MNANEPTSKPRSLSKKKTTFYAVEIWNHHFRDCRDLLTGNIAASVPQLFQKKDQTLSFGGWLVKICDRRKAIVITCRRDLLDQDLLCAKSLPLKSGTLYLLLDFNGKASVFFKEADYDELLRRKGIFSVERREDLNVEYFGDWKDSWITLPDMRRIPDQDLFWPMSNDVSAGCVIKPSNGGEELIEVKSPLDEQLAVYEGKISYRPTDATWVVTYELHRHNGSVSSGAKLYIKPDCELDEVVSQLSSYLKAMNYCAFDDCLRMITYMDYGSGV